MTPIMKLVEEKKPLAYIVSQPTKRLKHKHKSNRNNAASDSLDVAGIVAELQSRPKARTERSANVGKQRAPQLREH